MIQRKELKDGGAQRLVEITAEEGSECRGTQLRERSIVRTDWGQDRQHSCLQVLGCQRLFNLGFYIAAPQYSEDGHKSAVSRGHNLVTGFGQPLIQVVIE